MRCVAARRHSSEVLLIMTRNRIPGNIVDSIAIRFRFVRKTGSQLFAKVL